MGAKCSKIIECDKITAPKGSARLEFINNYQRRETRPG